MFKWIKSLSSNTDEDRTVEYFREINKSDISEPVYAILKAWKEDPKRFIFSTDFKYFDPWSDWMDSYTTVKFYDKISREGFDFYVRLTESANKAYDILFRSPPFTSHKLYVALGYTLISSPSWMTKDEVDYLEKNIVPYYVKRCERYIELIEYRKDRQRSQQHKLAQLTKQKERERLMELYK